jgi:hypothetical protein
MPLVRQSVRKMEGIASNNAHHGRAIDFVARLNQWFVLKNKTAEHCAAAARDTSTGTTRDSLKKLVVMEMHHVLEKLRQLKEDFRSLWLETNRSANLELLMMRYDRQIEYWEEMLRTFEERGGINDPLIASQWIYHPEAHPGKRDSSVSQVSRASFQKVFTLRQIPVSAKVQLIGDTPARLSVNGREIGAVFARRSLSLLVEHQRVKMWEIAPLLKPGENTIAVDVANYDRFGSAGVNVYGELKTSEGTLRIVSDSTWRVAAHALDERKMTGVPGDGWVPAAAKPFPNEVIAPNFETGRLSWIER